MRKLLKYVLTGLCISFLAHSCKKQDHFYKDFITGGEIIYVGKADSVLFHPGKNRARISWRIRDPNITKMRVYWNSRLDSLTIDVNKTNQVDSIGVLIEDLEERFYSFDIYSFDIEGNRSIRALIEGQVYGEEYISSLLNRVINNVSEEDNKVTINWFDPNSNMIGTEIRYIDVEGSTKHVFVPDTFVQNTLENVNVDFAIEYRTLFLPDTLAIDSLYTDFEKININ